MKSKLIIVGIIIAIILVVIVMVIVNHSNNSSSSFVLENKEDGSIIVTANNASENSGGIGEVTIQEGQKLEVKANLGEKGFIQMKVIPSSVDYKAEAVLNESFKKTEEREFELPSGIYNIFITAGKEATGNMTINVK